MEDGTRASGQERRASQEPLPDAEWIERQRAASLSRLSGGSDAPRAGAAPSAAPTPEHLSTAPSVVPPRSRFVEDFRRSAPTTVVDPDPLTARSSSQSAPLRAPMPARPSAFNRLVDRANRGWQVVKPYVDRAVRFAKENPWIMAGIAVGVVGGAVLAGPAGLLVGAGLGAAGAPMCNGPRVSPRNDLSPRRACRGVMRG